MDNFNLKQFLSENKLTTNSRILAEDDSIDLQKLYKVSKYLSDYGMEVGLYGDLPTGGEYDELIDAIKRKDFKTAGYLMGGQYADQNGDSSRSEEMMDDVAADELEHAFG